MRLYYYYCTSILSKKGIYMKRQKYVIGFAVLGVLIGSLQATPSPNFKVFLCFGQSNMSGGNGVQPATEDKQTNPRIKVLAFATSSCNGVSRTANQWSDASEPMHCGDGQNKLGPSYAFGRAIADSFPNDTIGLIPCGQWGVAIEYFMKGGNYTGTKPSVPGGNNVYQWMLTKCNVAKQRGVFSGIILHQGESNSGQTDWPAKVKKVYDSLKKDCGFGAVPLVAGELLYSGACSGHNTVIRQIPATMPGIGFVASAQGLSGVDQYHFNATGYRTLGQRFAVEMVKGLRQDKITQPKPRQRVVSAASVGSLQDKAKVYSLDGKFVSTGSAMTSAAVRSLMKRGNIYVVVNGARGSDARLMIAPNY
jgi:hypothetical protein